MHYNISFLRMQSVLTVVCSILFASRGYPGAHTIPRSLRYAAKRLYELCPKSFLTRRNRRTRIHGRFLLASASMLGISALHSTILQSLSSSAIRFRGIVCAPGTRGLRTTANNLWSIHLRSTCNNAILRI